MIHLYDTTMNEIDYQYSEIYHDPIADANFDVILA
jgi:hypothetical protein